MTSAFETILGEPLHRELFQIGKLIPKLCENCWPFAARLDQNVLKGKNAKTIPIANNQLGEFVRGNHGGDKSEAFKSMHHIRRTEALDERGRMIDLNTSESFRRLVAWTIKPNAQSNVPDVKDNESDSSRTWLHPLRNDGWWYCHI